MKKHIIFDFDDTISSSYELNQQLFVDTFLPHKPDIDQDYLRKLHFEKKGTSMIDQIQEVRDKYNLKPNVETIMKENEILHQQRSVEATIFDGVENLLVHFKKRQKIISLCTNRAYESLILILRKNNLEKYFDNIVSCLDNKHEKPDPYCLKELLDKYPNIDKGETIYFGDSKTDALFATNADIDYLVIDHYLNRKLFYSIILESFADAEDNSPLSG